MVTEVLTKCSCRSLCALTTGQFFLLPKFYTEPFVFPDLKVLRKITHNIVMSGGRVESPHF